MAEVAPKRAAAPAGEQPPQQLFGGISWTKILMFGGAYFALSTAVGYYFRRQQTGVLRDHPVTGLPVLVPDNTDDIPPYVFRPDPPAQLSLAHRESPVRMAPLWPQDSALDVVVVASSGMRPPALAQVPTQDVVFQAKGFRMDDWSDTRKASAEIAIPDQVRLRNATLWGHFYIARAGAIIDPAQEGYSIDDAYFFSWPLTQYVAKKKVARTRNLLEGRSEEAQQELLEDDKDVGQVQVLNYYHPNISLAFVPDTGVMGARSMHPAVAQFAQLVRNGARDGTGANTWYYPFLFVNTFWQLRNQLTEVNATTTSLPINIDLSNMANWKFSAMASIESSSRESARRAAWGQSMPGGGDGSELEMVKEVFFDTNPILLAITALVSVAHMILETLAFGSDIAHYRKKKDNVGISVRSILVNVGMQSVILLYLIDNSQNTSWMILGSQAVGIAIELWKITTVVDVRVRPAPPGSLLPFVVALEDKHKLSETEARTKEYDEIAFRYMYIAAVPLLLAYAVYSLYYDSHKSWYSYVITTLVGSVYAYGFLMMVPSLYINYRLKSVAHMPAKTMMYKSLNTFIDDLFAFTIKMPLLHRLATFRDDVIFFVYLYQRWIYRVDYTRVNERWWAACMRTGS
jgi:hypothetical protein